MPYAGCVFERVDHIASVIEKNALHTIGLSRKLKLLYLKGMVKGPFTHERLQSIRRFDPDESTDRIFLLIGHGVRFTDR